MEWTSKRPTASGLYWIKNDVGHTEIVRVDANESPEETEWDAVPLVYVEGVVGETTMDQFIMNRKNCLEWFGPIIPPDH